MDLHTVSYFFIASVLLTITPGPDFMFVFAQSISGGKKAGIVTGLGLCTGLLGHTTAAAVGISAIIYQSSLVFTLIKWLGALYLLYLAIQAFRERTDVAQQNMKRYTLMHLYRKGILMNLLNPKVSIFFLAFLPQFVNEHSGTVPLQMILLAGLFIIQALGIFLLLSVLAGSVGSKLLKKPILLRWSHRLRGVVFVFFSLRLFIQQK